MIREPVGRVAAVASQNFRRAGRSAAEVLVRLALSQVPVVGPILSGFAELISAVRDEVGKDAPVSRQEVLNLIRSLPGDEYERIVDEQLVSNSNAGAVRDLSPAQLLELRRQLVSLPQTLAQILDDAREMDQRSHTEAIAKLQTQIQDAFYAEQWRRANRIARRMMRLGVRDPKIIEIEQHAYARHIDAGRIGFYAATLVLAAAIVRLILARFDLQGDRTAHVVALFGSLLLLWWLATSSRLRIGARNCDPAFSNGQDSGSQNWSQCGHTL